MMTVVRNQNNATHSETTESQNNATQPETKEIVKCEERNNVLPPGLERDGVHIIVTILKFHELSNPRHQFQLARSSFLF